jgi:hypothetical protein
MATINSLITDNGTPYARIYNEGGTISQNIPITPKMRKFYWAKFFEAGGGKSKEKGQDVPEEAKFWRGMALTKKTSISRKVPVLPHRSSASSSLIHSVYTRCFSIFSLT